MNADQYLCATGYELRQFTKAAITPAYVSWLNDKALMRFSGQSAKNHSIQSCHDYLESFHGSGNFFWSVHRQSDDTMIGTMTAYLNHRDSIADIGILIGDASAQGKGVGTIAWRIAMEYLFRAQHIRKLTAGTISEHTAMIRIFERNHMKQEGCLRSHQVLNERVFDVVLYGILREEWP